MRRRESVLPYADVFAALNASGVRYVVVGGIAVVLHGHARMTVDLDLVVDLSADAATSAVDTVLGLGFVPRIPVDPHQFADAKTRNEWIANKNMQVLSFYDPTSPLREVDLFARHPVPFEELYAASAEMNTGGIQVRVASVEHLIQMKRAVGRAQDLADVDALESLQDDD